MPHIIAAFVHTISVPRFKITVGGCVACSIQGDHSVCTPAQVDAIGGARFDDGQGGDNEVQRTMLEIVNQLDGFDSRGNIKARAPRTLELGIPAGDAGL